jgi:hypothetical protein
MPERRSAVKLGLVLRLLVAVLVLSLASRSSARIVHIGRGGVDWSQLRIFSDAALADDSLPPRWSVASAAVFAARQPASAFVRRAALVLVAHVAEPSAPTPPCALADAVFRPLLADASAAALLATRSLSLYVGVDVASELRKSALRRVILSLPDNDNDDDDASALRALPERGTVWFHNLTLLIPDAPAPREPPTAFAGLARGGGGTNLAAPLHCDARQCAAWLVQHVVPLVSAARRMSVHVVMLYDAPQRRWGDGVEALNRQRALAAGWTFESEHASLIRDGSRATAWSKVLLLQRALREARADWVIWLDADAVLQADAAPRVEALLQLAANSGRDAVLSADPPLWQCQNLCTGVMAWRATDWSRDFLAEWWRDADTRWGGTFRHAFAWEQRILNAVWSEHASRFFVAPYCALNAECGTTDAEPMVVHCMGADASTRMARVEREKARAIGAAHAARAVAVLALGVPAEQAAAAARVPLGDVRQWTSRSAEELRLDLCRFEVLVTSGDDAPLLATAIALWHRCRARTRLVAVESRPGGELACKALVERARSHNIEYVHALLRP